MNDNQEGYFKDYNKYPLDNPIYYSYNEIKIVIERPYGTYLKGEILYNIKNLSNGKKIMITDVIHWWDGRKLCTECNHLGDWWPYSGNEYGKYRNVDYILNNLISVIDILLDTKNKKIVSTTEKK